jgi:hypothetical protein
LIQVGGELEATDIWLTFYRNELTLKNRCFLHVPVPTQLIFGLHFYRNQLIFKIGVFFTGHTRSFSHGGVTFSRTNSGREKNPSGAAAAAGGPHPPPNFPPPGVGGVGGVAAADFLSRPPGGFIPLPPSALKKPGHRRVFSHGQIGSPEQQLVAGGGGGGGGGVRGHARSGSKTDFILPPGHEIRERKR